MAGFAERLATAQQLGGRALIHVTIASALLLFTTAAHAFCVGDCRAENKRVTVDELLTGVDILVNGGDPAACPEFDADESGQVTINEVVSGINNALHGCEPTPSCVLARSSSIVLNTSLPPLSLDALGTLDVTCGDIDPVTGQAPCTCNVVQFEPLNIPGIGYVCVTPFAGCQPGFIDCDGGSNISVELFSDHNIGDCTGNDDCKVKCQAYCTGIGKVPTISGFGCEGFCNGGDRDTLPCNCDSAAGATCGKKCSGGTVTTCTSNDDCPAGETCVPNVGECPNGSCNGPDNVGFGNICQCQCVDTAVGPATEAGGLRCNLGISLIVERPTLNPCIDDPNSRLITVGSSCVPMTTDTANTVLHNANNVKHCATNTTIPCVEDAECEIFLPGDTCVDAFGPFAETGHGIECAALSATGRAKGLQARGVVSFFGSSIGDIVTRVNADCR